MPPQNSKPTHKKPETATSAEIAQHKSSQITSARDILRQLTKRENPFGNDSPHQPAGLLTNHPTDTSKALSKRPNKRARITFASDLTQTDTPEKQPEVKTVHESFQPLSWSDKQKYLTRAQSLFNQHVPDYIYPTDYRSSNYTATWHMENIRNLYLGQNDRSAIEDISESIEIFQHLQYKDAIEKEAQEHTTCSNKIPYLSRISKKRNFLHIHTRLENTKDYIKNIHAQISEHISTIDSIVFQCNNTLKHYTQDHKIIHFLPEMNTLRPFYSAQNKRRLKEIVSVLPIHFNREAIQKDVYSKIDACFDLEDRIHKLQIARKDAVNSHLNREARRERKAITDHLMASRPHKQSELQRGLIQELIPIHALDIKKIDPNIIREFRASVMEDKEQKDNRILATRERIDDNEQGAPLLSEQRSVLKKRLDYCSTIIDFIESDVIDINQARSAIIALSHLYTSLYKRSSLTETYEKILNEKKELPKNILFNELQKINIIQISYLQKELESPQKGKQKKEQSVTWPPQEQIAALKRTTSLHPTEMSSSPLPVQTPSFYNIESDIFRPDHSVSAITPTVAKSLLRSPHSAARSLLASPEQKLKKLDTPLTLADTDISKETCDQACAKMLAAWKYWKDSFKEDLKELDTIYGNGKNKQRPPLKYSGPNPAAFFAHMVTHEKLPCPPGTQQTGDFTLNDLINALDPRFPSNGQKFLQEEWRVKEGESWNSGKNYKPRDNVADGDQRLDGQHEWIPTAKTAKVLHTVLKYYSKQDQLAWISALDILRTPTSEIAINFTWNSGLNVQGVNDHPEKYTVSQLGSWEHHSGGLYSPQQQINKGNGPFHDKINQLIDNRLDPTRSQLPELLNDLRNFAMQHLFGGETTKFPDLTPEAMERITNDFTRHTQKNPNREPQTYGQFELESTMHTVATQDGEETIGTTIFKEAKNLAELLRSFAETKQRILEMFDNRIDALNSYYQLDVNSYLKGTHFDLETDTYGTEALIAQLHGDNANAIKHWGKVYTNVRNRYGENSPFIITSSRMLGSLHRQNGNYSEASELLQRCHQINETHNNSRETLNSHLELAEFYREFHQSKNAIHHAQKGFFLSQSLRKNNPGDTALQETTLKGMHLLISLYCDDNDTHDKKPLVLGLLKKSKTMINELQQKKSPNITTLSLSHFLQTIRLKAACNQYDETFETEVKEALELSQNTDNLVQQAKYRGSILFEYGKYLAQRGSTDQALAQWEHAQEAFQQYPEIYWREMAQVAYTSGNFCIQQTEQEKSAQEELAQKYYVEAHHIYLNHLGYIGHPFHLEIMQKLLTHYNNTNQEDERDTLLKQAATIDHSKQIISSKVAGHLLQIAEQYQKQENTEKAQKALEDAFKISSRRLGKGHRETRNICRKLIKFFQEQKNYNEAVHWTDRLCRYEREVRQLIPTLETIDLAGTIYTHVRRYPDAEHLYQIALEKHMILAEEKSFVRLKDTPQGNLYKARMADLQLKQGQLEAAEQTLESVFEPHNDNAFHDDQKEVHQLAIITYDNLAQAYSNQKEYEKAINALYKAKDILLYYKQENDPDLIKVDQRITTVEKQQNNRPETFTVYPLK